ncbi:MAG: isoleucine--tRNA ligase [Bacilli bacterium]
MEVKQTLLMPKTTFEMRGNLAQKEPNVLEKWQKQDIYNEMNERHKGNKSYVLHDGPPYANGNIHCGHMLNRILKDFILRYKNMQGFYTPFIFGWDTHGLPIENNVTKSGVNRKTTPIVEFRKKCEEYALKQVANQKQQIIRLGVLGDFGNPYLTLNKDFEKSEIEVFATMALKGLIFKGLKPVYWSYSSESALAEAEIEYKDVESSTIYVAFDVLDGKNVIPNDAKVVIWTTTPWTLPANLAICLNETYEYGLFDTNIGKLVFLEKFKDKLFDVFKLEKCELIKTFKGKELEFATCKHPFLDKESLIICGDHVTDEAGTGCVHTAPGHGEDDYIVGKKYGLVPLCPVDYKGVMTEEAGEEVAGMFYEAANEKIISMLKESGKLLNLEKIVHSYPHDWRTGKPVIFRATPQWFCSIEPIREDLLKSIKEVKWTPSWGEIRIHNMIKDRGDWCISRQRVWGVPIPIIYAEDGTPIMEKEVFDHIAQLVGEHGSSIWYELDEKELLPEGYKNSHSPNGIFKKEKDIMDVWFDSGSSFNGVLKERGINYPADLYLEGSDQYRGWFNSSLIISQAVFGCAPYKNVVSHGFIMDEKWEKMSKSAGNGIDPIKITNVYGADILRFWAANVDYQQDVRISEDIIKQCTEGYRKIRNTFKFLLGNLSNGDGKSFVKEDIQSTFENVDLYILAKLEQVKNKVISYLENYNFQLATQEILNFMTNDLSSFYLDVTKDILYCENAKSLRRLQVQTVIYYIIDDLMRLLNPIIPFTMDEVNASFGLSGEENVQLLSFPKETHNYASELLNEYQQVITLRTDVLKAIELQRRAGIIGSAQEAFVFILLKSNNPIEKFSQIELNRLFIVSKATIVTKLDNNDAYTGELSQVLVTKASTHKCERCWNYVDETYNVDGTELCERCKEAIK